ncbi:MAG: 5-bromo-4-chloroindolyl phosphate hydrolysis family protein [Clostridiales bacterium]|nr:5-bromo-4-chloroindolyl phosphate hydrolysis family protein [Clostridiales bacterium]
MSNKQESNIPWWAIVLGFIFCWPIGMVLLFLNIAGVRIPIDKIKDGVQQDYRSSAGAGPYAPSGAAGHQQRRQTPPPTSSASSYAGQSQNGAATQRPYSYGRGQAQSQPAGRRFPKEPRGGSVMTVCGGAAAFVFLLGLVDEISTFGLAYPRDWFPLFGFFCAGLAVLGTGISRTRLARRQRLYLGVIGRRSSVFLSDLAGAAGVSEKRVTADLQRMLSDGVLPMGYIDRASGRLVLTDQGYEPAPEQPKQQASDSGKSREKNADDAILRQIREVNDAIPDAEMSRKIDRIEEITRKILDYQRKNPSKADQLRQFLNYYLPTTLKILNAYAQMDAQGVEGKNISAAKARIEGMMDKVVEGFEKQLDQLFQTDAMDITADVEVLERMLDKDGLGSGMTMGG